MAFTGGPISVVLTDSLGNSLNLGSGSGPFTGGPISVVITDNQGNAMQVGAGGAVAKFDATAQAANIPATTLYTVPVGKSGTYRISAYAVVTQAATTSSTLPQISYLYTDNDTGVSNGPYGLAGSSGVNTVGGTNSDLGAPLSPGIFNAQVGSAIKFSTVGYASSGATPMQYAIHVKLEYLGA